MIEWRFPSNDYGENKGINDTGVAMFRGTPLKSLAREICQNSLDASKKFPVTVEFSLFSVNTSEVPGNSVLKDSFDKCLEFWKGKKAITTKEYFENAIKVISRPECEVLRISDFNTVGLTGSREEINTNWTDLTKSSGSSDKKGTAGGSFGIGKYAPFACSEFSTVFYSTYDENKQQAYQGVSRLVTFRRDDNQNTQGIGYFGNVRNTPVHKQLKLDDNFERSEDEFGTDIYVIGYKYSREGWERDILVSILDGFLGAIWNGRLEVRIGDIIVNKATLDELIEKYKDDLIGYTDKYFEVLKSEETNWIIDNFIGLGEVKLGLLLGNTDYPKKVAMIRSTGMKIKDKDRLPGYVPFVGVMFINGEDINKRLRLIENPEHTEWQPDRAKYPYKEKQLLNELYKFIRKSIEEIVSRGSSYEIDAVGVGNFLPDIDAAAEAMNPMEAVIDNVLNIEKKKVKKTATPNANSAMITEIDIQTATGTNEPGNQGTGWAHPGGTTYNPGPKPPGQVQGDEGDCGTSLKPSGIKLVKFIPVCIDKSKGKYMVMLTTESSGKNAYIDLYLSAETQRYEAPIVSAKVIGSDCKFEGNRISQLDFKKDETIRISLELDYSDYCSMEVQAYAIKE